MGVKSQAQSDRRLLAGGATLTVFGIATSTGELGSVAGLLTLSGLICLIVGLHRFGRTGPDQPIARAPAAKIKAKTKRAKQARPVPPRP